MRKNVKERAEMKKIQQIEQTLDSREVAEMVEKTHGKLIRDIRRYEEQLNEANIGSVDFFRESTYKDSKGEIRPCYQITKKGCEFIAHKLTGTKGTIFTARYINRFHEMQEILSNKEQEPETPWFIRKFRNVNIMLFRDFKTITGIEMSGNYTAYKRPNKLIGGLHYNGWGWKCDNEKFKQEYGFDYGTDSCMMYLYPSGIAKALRIYTEDGGNRDSEAYRIISEGLETIQKPKKKEIEIQRTKPIIISGNKELPIQINIVLQESVKVV